MVDLHKATKRACIDKDMTISDLAIKMGVNRKTLYSAISNGNPRLSTINGIAYSLDIKTSELIGMGEDNE